MAGEAMAQQGRPAADRHLARPLSVYPQAEAARVGKRQIAPVPEPDRQNESDKSKFIVHAGKLGSRHSFVFG